MPAFTRDPHLFDFLGVDLAHPVDRLGPGKYPRATNVRSVTAHTIQGRAGLGTTIGTVAAAIHSIFRLNDGTPFNGGTSALRVVGSADAIYAGGPNGPYAGIENGYSGDPLSAVVISPYASPQPWLYIADTNKQRKLATNKTISQSPVDMGIAAPTIAPTAALGVPLAVTLTDFSAVGPWLPAGAMSGAIAVQNRVTTTITAILYDSGNTGWASIAPASMAGIGIGAFLTLGAAETVLVNDVKVPVASTTIAAILYDAGATGLCTIVPAASLGTGQLQNTDLAEAQSRYYPEGDDPVLDPKSRTDVDPTKLDSGVVPQIRPIDFSVDSVVLLGGSEYVRVLSVAVGNDGIQSFRCSTVGTFAATNAIAGAGSFRAYLTTTRAAGNAVATDALRNQLTNAAGAIFGGVYAPLVVNLAQIGTRPTQADDEIHLSIRVDAITTVSKIRVYFDVDRAANDFLRNYYWFEWSANDILASVQGTNLAAVQSVVASRETVVVNNQIREIDTQLPEGDADTSTSDAISAGANSGQLPFGNSQWAELRCRVADLIHAGTDTTRTLKDVAAVEILVYASGTVSPITVDYDALWLAGGYGADVGEIGTPIVYAYRGRSSLTGAKSNPSPPMRGGLSPRRQLVNVTGTHFSDTQVDLIDWFRMGNNLSDWTYIGTSPNDSPPTFADSYPDLAVVNAERADFECYQPWPVSDIPRTGTCTVVGTSVQRTTGDTFNTGWAPGTQIIINGQTYSLYANPSSTTRLELNENAGSGTNLPYTIPYPTLLGQKFPRLWGPYDAGGGVGLFLFACGDTRAPGDLVWTRGNDPDVTTTAYRLSVTSPGEPLVNGLVRDEVSLVFSTDNLYRIEPDFSRPNVFRAIQTPCARGLWAPWAFTVAPEGIYFVSRDGIYLSDSGSPAVSITDEDLYPLFPHNGEPGVAVNGYNPPNMTLTTQLRLTWAGRYLYFDYMDTSGNPMSLVFDRLTKGWVFDSYIQTGVQGTSGVAMRLLDPGSGASQVVCGGRDGGVYVSNAQTDNTHPYTGLVRTRSENNGDSRSNKTYSDIMVDLKTGTAALDVTVGFNRFNQVQYLAQGMVVPTEDLIGLGFVNGTTIPGHDIGMEFSWSAIDLVVLHEWQPSLIVEGNDILKSSWQTKGSALGLSGFTHLRDGWIAYASQSDVTFILMVDGNPVYCTPNPLPSTGGGYQKVYIVFPPVKGHLYTLFLTSTQGFVVYPRDCEFRGRSWGSPEAYTSVNPLADQYRAVS